MMCCGSFFTTTWLCDRNWFPVDPNWCYHGEGWWFCPEHGCATTPSETHHPDPSLPTCNKTVFSWADHNHACWRRHEHIDGSQMLAYTTIDTVHACECGKTWTTKESNPHYSPQAFFEAATTVVYLVPAETSDVPDW